MSGEVRTLVFDLDGTLAETAGDLIGALNVVLDREGIEAVPVAAARSLLGAGGRALIQRGFARAGRDLSAAKLDALFADFLAHYNAHIADNSWLFPGAEAALDRFAALGWRLAVCTNKMEHSSHLLLGKLGVAEKFQFICGQDTFGVAKPDPRPLVETIRKAGGQPRARSWSGIPSPTSRPRAPRERPSLRWISATPTFRSPSSAPTA